MSRMLSSISCSRETSAIRPVASVRNGKAQPEPMNSSLIAPSPWSVPPRRSSSACPLARRSPPPVAARVRPACRRPSPSGSPWCIAPGHRACRSPCRPCSRLVPASHHLQRTAVDVNHRAGDLQLSARLYLELRPAVERGPGRPLQIEVAPSFELDRLLCLEVEIRLGLERHVLLTFHVHLPLRRDMDLRV